MRNDDNKVKVERISEVKAAKNKTVIKEERKASDEGISSQNSKSEGEIQNKVRHLLSCIVIPHIMS